MNTKPILFNTEMVRALLDGSKSQTRRIVKPRIAEDIEFLSGGPEGEPGESQYLGIKWDRFLDDDEKEKGPEQWLAYCSEYPEEGCIPIGTGYGQPGDLLYVKEACWMWGRWLEDGKTKTGHQAWRFEADQHDPRTVFDKPDWTVKRNGDVGWVYRHARFMPRKNSRLTLRITNIRVERVQEMEGQHPTESDALTEGIHSIHHGDGNYFYSAFRNEPSGKNWCNPSFAFKELWNSIHGPDAWDRNDWVWVIELEVIKQNVDDLIAGASNYAGVTV